MFVPCFSAADITLIGNNNQIVTGSIPTWTATAKGIWVINQCNVPIFVMAENGAVILLALRGRNFAIRRLRDQVRQPQIRFDNTKSGSAGAITTASDWQVWLWALDWSPDSDVMGAI